MQLSALTKDEFKQNGAELRADGSVRLLHEQSPRRTSQRFEQSDAAGRRTFVLTGSTPAVFRIEHEQGATWEYAYVSRTWYRVLPKTPAATREFKPLRTNPSSEELILTPIAIPLPQAGMITLGPVVLHSCGALEFGENLYRRGKAIDNHEHLGFLAKRKRGRTQMLTIRRTGGIASDEELPLLLRYEWGVWRRFVRRKPTFAGRFKHHFREASLPLSSSLEMLLNVLMHVSLWSVAVVASFFLVLILVAVLMSL